MIYGGGTPRQDLKRINKNILVKCLWFEVTKCIKETQIKTQLFAKTQFFIFILAVLSEISHCDTKGFPRPPHLFFWGLSISEFFSMALNTRSPSQNDSHPFSHEQDLSTLLLSVIPLPRHGYTVHYNLITDARSMNISRRTFPVTLTEWFVVVFF